MTAAPIMPRTGFKFMMTVREGPDKGVAFQLLPPHVTIGRGTDNHVALRDPRMSRSSAVIDFTPEVIIVRDVSNRGTLVVNGQNVHEASIKDGDVIRIGETEMVFVVEAIQLMPGNELVVRPPRPMPGAENHTALTAPGGFTPPPAMPPPPHAAPRPMPQASAPNPERAKRIRFYGIVGVVLLAGAWLLNDSPVTKKKETGLRSVEEIEKEIKGSEEFQEQIIKKRQMTDEQKTRYEEAQRHYLEGFRDYQKGQWVRAMRSFETARAIDPEHELARRYYKLAEKQRDEMVSLLMIEGRRYREKNMFPRCVAALEKVLDAIPNKDDVKYKQAEALMKECELLIDERFR